MTPPPPVKQPMHDVLTSQFPVAIFAWSESYLSGGGICVIENSIIVILLWPAAVVLRIRMYVGRLCAGYCREIIVLLYRSMMCC